MRKNASAGILATIALMLATSGCSTMQKSDSGALQGRWSGTENGQQGPRHLAVSGTKIEYQGSNPDDWAKGTFTLQESTNPKQLLFAIKECGVAKYVGTTGRAIYKLEGSTLVVTGNEPGDPAVPMSFEAEGARRFEFKRE